MGRARATQLVAGPVAAVEALWYEPDRWPAWIDGFGHVVSLHGEWPGEGSVLDWNSKPNGRGRVRERVTEYAPGKGQSASIEDETLTGTQTVAFAPDGDRVRVTLTLEYSVKDRNALTPLVDALFIRRSMSASLQRSLARFARERAADGDLRH